MNFHGSAVTIVFGLLLPALQGLAESIQEAAVIIAHSEELSLDQLANESPVLFMCAAYGEPLPIITWSSPTLDIEDYSNITNTSVSRYSTVNSTIVQDEINNLTIVISVLELCRLEENKTIVCKADNGIDVDNPIGVSTIKFGQIPITIEKPIFPSLPTEPIVDRSVIIYITTGALLCIIIITAIVSFTVIMVVWLNRRYSKGKRQSMLQPDVYRKYHNALYEQEQSQAASSGDNRPLQRRDLEVYRRYNNELYDGNHRNRKTSRDDDSLTYCEAYNLAADNPIHPASRIRHEYTYIEGNSTQEIDGANNIQGRNRITLQQCQAYGPPPSQQGLDDSEENMASWKKGHTYEEIM